MTICLKTICIVVEFKTNHFDQIICEVLEHKNYRLIRLLVVILNP